MIAAFQCLFYLVWGSARLDPLARNLTSSLVTVTTLGSLLPLGLKIRTRAFLAVYHFIRLLSRCFIRFFSAIFSFFTVIDSDSLLCSILTEQRLPSILATD